MDYVTIDNFFRNINSRYRECILRIEDSKVYFEDKYRKLKSVEMLLVSSLICTLVCIPVCIAFNPRKRAIYPNETLKAIAQYVFIIYLIFMGIWFLFFSLQLLIKYYNVIDYKNGCLNTELWLMDFKLSTLDKFGNKDFFLVMNNVIPESFNPAGKSSDSVQGVPVVVDKKTDLFFKNEVLLLAQNGKIIHLWLGYSVESYSNCIELVDFISDMWNIRKLTCESNRRFEISYNKEYDIKKKIISYD